MRLPSDGAVHRSGVDVAIAERLRDRPRHRALAGARRSIDGDDQSLHSNLSRIARGPRAIGVRAEADTRCVVRCIAMSRRVVVTIGVVAVLTLVYVGVPYARA